MAALQSLSDIFTRTLFRIPDYQRGYAWTLKELQDFWDDLYNLSNDRSHYTGVLTVKKVPDEVVNTSGWNDEHWVISERGYRAFHVVDGQQRLTTAIIFIQSLAETVMELPENRDKQEDSIYVGSFSLKDIRELFLMIVKPQGIIKTFKFGYESDNPSFKFLRYRIFNEENGGTINETFYTLNLENAKIFFKEKLVAIYSAEGLKGLAELFKKLTINFRFNVYEIEQDFDVFVAFETMNNRGKKLSSLELLKNRLIYLTTLYDATQLSNDDRFALRSQIDDTWKEVYFQLGRNKKSPLNDDEFLYAHWIIYFQYSRQKGNVYTNYLLNEKFSPKNIYEKREILVKGLEKFEEITDEEKGEEVASEEKLEETGSPFQKIMDKLSNAETKLRPSEIAAYISNLKAASVHWYYSFNPNENPDTTNDEKKWIDRLNRIGISYFRPLIVASFLNDSITAEQRVKMLVEIERFIFIDFRLSRALSNHRNSHFYKAARLLREGEITVDDIISELKSNVEYAFKDVLEQHSEDKPEIADMPEDVKESRKIVDSQWEEYDRLDNEWKKNHEQNIRNLADEQYEKYSTAAEEYTALRKKYNLVFIDPTLFKKHMDKHFQNGGGFYSWNGLKYFLYEYEMALVEQRGSKKIDWAFFIKNEGDKVSIEHILPQTPDKDCWKEILKGYNKAEVLKLQGTLGNLVPLSQSVNSSIQNDCFDEKRKAKFDTKGNKIRLGYNDGSHSEIEVSIFEKWTPIEIQLRGLSLLHFMEKRWNFKFENDEDRLSILNLEFLLKN